MFGKYYRTIFVVIFVGIVLGVVIESVFSLPYADDFDYFLMMKRGIQSGSGYFESAFDIAHGYYLGWSGDYISVFLISFLSPFLWGGTTAISFFVFLTTVFLFISIFLASCAISKRIFSKDTEGIGAILSIFIVLGWLGTNNPSEFLFWYTCAYSYCLGTSCLLMLLYGILERKKSIFILIFAILATGMSLPTAFLSVGMILACWLVGIFDNKKQGVIASAFVFVGAAIVIFAPGNISRSNSTGVEDSFFEQLFLGIFNTAKCIARIGIKQILVSPFTWLIVLGIIIMQLFPITLKHTDYSTQWVVARVIAGILVIYTSVFPICFGYRLSFMSPRTESIATLVIWVIIIYWMVCLTNVIKAKIPHCRLDISLNKIIFGIYLVVVIISWVIFDNSGLRAYTEVFSAKAFLQWKNWSDIYEIVEATDAKDVEVTFENEYLTDLMTIHDHVDYDGDVRISNRYMQFCEKEELTVTWICNNDEIVLKGYGEKNE